MRSDGRFMQMLLQLQFKAVPTCSVFIIITFTHHKKLQMMRKLSKMKNYFKSKMFRYKDRSSNKLLMTLMMRTIFGMK